MHYNKFLIQILVILLHGPINCQIIDWHGYINGGFFNIINTSAVSNGNLFYGGHFIGPTDLDPNPASNSHFIPGTWNKQPFIGKLKPNRQVEWIKTLVADDAKIINLHPTSAGGIIFTIGIEKYIDLDPGADSLIVSNWFQQGTIILCEWDKYCKPQWYWEIYNSAQNAHTLLLDHPQGGYVLVGSEAGIVGMRNLQDTISFPSPGSEFAFYIHIDDDGNFIKYETYGGNGGRMSINPNSTVHTTNSDSIFWITGTIRDSPVITINGIPESFPPKYGSQYDRGFIGKLNFQGEMLQFVPIEGTGKSQPIDIFPDGVEGKYYAGYFTDTIFLPRSTDTLQFISMKNNDLSSNADMIVGRLDSNNIWLWTHHLIGGFKTNGTTSATFSNSITNNPLLLATTLDDVVINSDTNEKPLVKQMANNSAFILPIHPDGRIGCAITVIEQYPDYHDLQVQGMLQFDSFRYYWYGIYTDTLTLFDGTTFPAGSRASYMIDALFCPEYPCADIETAPCSDTLRACTWSASSWRWYKDGIHLPQADGDSLLVISDNGMYMLIATLEDDCPYQRPDTALVEISHFIPYFVEVQPVNCQWGQPGTAFVHVIGGIGPFLYRLDSLPYQANPLFEDLAAGMHAIHINSQENGCEFMDSLYIDSLTATQLQTYRCHGDTLVVGHHNFHSGEVDTLLLLESLVHPGCDSAVFLMAHFTPPALLSTTIEYVCDSTEESVDTVAILFSSSPCDSLVAIHQYLWAPAWHYDSLVWLCEGDSIYLNNFWHREEASVELNYTSSQGCDSILFLEIRMVRPPVFDTYLDTLVPAGMTITLHAPLATGYLYAWDPMDGLSCSDCPNPSLHAEEDRTFTLYFSDEQGCFNHIAIYSVRVFAHEIALPNLFTPNGDGVNDKFGPLVLNGPASSVQILNFTIFNRWGQAIYNSNDPISAWDGSCAGTPCPMDTYVWVLEVSLANGQHQVLRGDINLIR